MNSSDLIFRATSIEVSVASDCNVVGALSLLLVVLLGIVGGAIIDESALSFGSIILTVGVSLAVVGVGMGVVGRRIK